MCSTLRQAVKKQKNMYTSIIVYMASFSHNRFQLFDKSPLHPVLYDNPLNPIKMLSVVSNHGKPQAPRMSRDHHI